MSYINGSIQYCDLSASLSVMSLSFSPLLHVVGFLCFWDWIMFLCVGTTWCLFVHWLRDILGVLSFENSTMNMDANISSWPQFQFCWVYLVNPENHMVIIIFWGTPYFLCRLSHFALYLTVYKCSNFPLPWTTFVVFCVCFSLSSWLPS